MKDTDENNNMLLEEISSSRKVSAMSDMLQTISTTMCNLNSQLHGQIDTYEKQVLNFNKRQLSRQNYENDDDGDDDGDDDSDNKNSFLTQEMPFRVQIAQI
jgi:hypothetical protein